MTIADIIKYAITEDIGDGDHTSLATVPATAKGEAQLLIKESGIIAGIDIAKEVFFALSDMVEFSPCIVDGTAVKPGDIAFVLKGPSRVLLKGERLALNFMQRMSGIATTTHHLASKIKKYPVKILDTRKTTPLLRTLEKYAVQIGGGGNHRMGLYDMIMIKDNHVDFSGGITNAIEKTKRYLAENNKTLKIEIEVRNFIELRQVLDTGGINRIMLDNFSVEETKRAVDIINKKYETEASGGITEENIVAYAETGVDYISVGALTHHIRSLDMSLKALQ